MYICNISTLTPSGIAIYPPSATLDVITEQVQHGGQCATQIVANLINL